MTLLTKPNINNQDPFYRSYLTETLFDQSNTPKERQVLPLRPFQQSILALSTLFRFLNINAPSQSGKTTAVEALAATIIYEIPGSQVLILSTREEQAERLIRDIRELFILNNRIPELRKLSRKGGDTSDRLELQHNGSSILAVPHSMKAITGNPANVVLLDEVARWDKEEPATIYAEAVARTGDRHGQVISISTFNGQGYPDTTQPQGYRGNFFHYLFQKTFPHIPTHPDTASIRFTYHVSPRLSDPKNHQSLKQELKSMGPGYYEEHMLGIPRPQTGHALFAQHFDASQHIRSDNKLKELIDENFPLALCFDPGWNRQAAVLAQFIPDRPQILYLRTFIGEKLDLGKFIDVVLSKVWREFPGFPIQYFMDVAGRQTNKQTGLTDVTILEHKTNQYAYTLKQLVAPGVQLIISYMNKTNGLLISDHPSNTILIEAFQSIPAKLRNDVPQMEYEKEGYLEHPTDCARYILYALSSALPPDAYKNYDTNKDYILLRSQ